MSDEPNSNNECDAAECFLPRNRRQFLRDMGISAAAALMAAGCSRTAALGMPMGFANGTVAADSTVVYAIPAADGAQIDKENDVILVRWQNAVYAFDLSCPHQNTALRWGARSTFECPKHHSEFRPTGEYIPGSGRATRNMDRLAITRENAQVRVDVDKVYRDDEQTAQWNAAVVKL